jgi:hypothetical protein
MGDNAMPSDESQILVVLREGALPPSDILAAGRVSHSISARVFTLDVDSPAGLAGLQADPAVDWAGTQPPPRVRDELTPPERLFVDGWLRRRAGKPARPGEGLAWDSPGRLPP